MNNFLADIENEYSRIRGKASRLSPLDWNLAAEWERRGIPLRVVRGAMADVQKNFNAEHRPDKINRLSYFTQAVEKRFADWLTSQVGASPAPETIHRKTEFEETEMTETIADENAAILEAITENLPDASDFPEPLKSAARVLRGELCALLDDVRQKQLSTDDVEARLTAIRAELEISLIVSVAEPERAELIEQARTEYAGYNFTEEVQKKMTIRRLYKKFGLPELSLFAF